jgi:DNA (cytosine-5)-methyltransferase 1
MTVSAAVPRFRQPAQVPFNFSELVIDSFAGGGGASTGIERALGRAVDIAINHDLDAIRMHEVNHPHTRHYCESVWDVDPRKVCDGRPVGLAWFSPDCKHFSKAKGAKPVEKAVRGLAWVVLRWAATVLPRVIMLENVEEFVTWGPLVRREDGMHYPCPKNRGRTFNSFVNALRRHGYRVEWRELRACDYGAPTIRKRLFLIARCDGEPIVWPEPTHGDPKKAAGLLSWRTAAECIDWSIPCPSIFERKKPLAEATLRRIAKGIMRYVVESPEPFIVSYYGEKKGDRGRGQTLIEPLRTQTTENRFALVAPVLTEHSNASSPRCMPAGEPLRTICASPKGGHHALVTAFLAKHYGGVVGTSLQVPSGTVTTVDHHSLVAAHMVRSFGESVGSHPEAPVGTITAGGMGKTGIVAANLVRNFGRSAGADAAEPSCTITGKMKDSLVSSHLVKLRGTCADGQPVTVPLHTVSAQGQHFGEVRAFLMQYHGVGESHDLKKPINTVTTKDRFGLVTVRGVEYQIVDIGMRMLTPRELFRAQGFPEDYIIDRDAAGRAITKTDQVARCGNSVCPPMSEVLVRANLASAVRERAAV